MQVDQQMDAGMEEEAMDMEGNMEMEGAVEEQSPEQPLA